MPGEWLKSDEIATTVQRALTEDAMDQAEIRAIEPISCPEIEEVYDAQAARQVDPLACTSG